jgi:hypothetical protein
MRRLLDKVNNPSVVLIVLVLGMLVLGISVNESAYFSNNRDSDQGPIVEEKRGPPRAEGASPGTPKKDAEPEVGRGAVGGDRGEASPVREARPHPPQPATASSGASPEGGLPVGTSVPATVPAPQATAPPPTAPPATAPPATATPTATASFTAAATAQYAQYATATPTALPPSGGPSLAVPLALVAVLAALVLLRRAPS